MQEKFEDDNACNVVHEKVNLIIVFPDGGDDMTNPDISTCLFSAILISDHCYYFNCCIINH